MWNRRSWLLYVRIRLRGLGPPLNLLLPLALFVPHQLMLAWAGLLALLPGAGGRKVRMIADTLHGILLHLLSAQPQRLADINISDKKQHIRVVVRTVGFGGGDEL